MKTITVKDPRGIEWHVYHTGEIVHTDALERAVSQSSMSEKDKKNRRASTGYREAFRFPVGSSSGTTGGASASGTASIRRAA